MSKEKNKLSEQDLKELEELEKSFESPKLSKEEEIKGLQDYLNEMHKRFYTHLNNTYHFEDNDNKIFDSLASNIFEGLFLYRNNIEKRKELGEQFDTIFDNISKKNKIVFDDRSILFIMLMFEGINIATNNALTEDDEYYSYLEDQFYGHQDLYKYIVKRFERQEPKMF